MALPRIISIVLSIFSFVGICVLCIYCIVVNKSISKEEMALLSSLTIVLLTALYVMTTIDQTSSMSKQIDEMKNDRKYQQQPLLVPSIDEFKLDAPRLFFSPPTKEYIFAIRGYVNINLKNISPIPVVNVKVKCILYTMQNKTKLIECECCSAEDAISSSAAVSKSMMLQVPHPNELCDVIRSQDTPFLDVEVLYDNIMGAHFVVHKQFSIYQKEEDNKYIVKWHSDLVSFDTKEKESMIKLYALLHKNMDTEKLFNSIKNKYIYKPSEILFYSYYVPGHIETGFVDDNKYKELSSSYFYGRRIKFNAILPCEDET